MFLHYIELMLYFDILVVLTPDPLTPEDILQTTSDFERDWFLLLSIPYVRKKNDWGISEALKLFPLEIIFFTSSCSINPLIAPIFAILNHSEVSGAIIKHAQIF